MSTDNTLSQAASFDDATSTDELIRRDRKVTFHASTHLRDFAQGDAPGRVITGGEGIRIRERDGRELIDGFAGELFGEGQALDANDHYIILPDAIGAGQNTQHKPR